jgi:hypothetical protein
MEFAEMKDAALLVIMFIVFGVPAMAVAARLAIRPTADAIVRLRESAAPGRAPEGRFEALEAEVGQLRQEVRRLAEAEAFARELARPTDSGALLPTGGPPA